MQEKPNFTVGHNIAMKLPERVYTQTLAFYKEVLNLPILSEKEDGAAVDFGGFTLHLDRVPQQSQTDIWLQVRTDDVGAAQAYLAEQGIAACNEVEKLPDGFEGFWVASPSGTIHLVAKTPSDNG